MGLALGFDNNLLIDIYMFGYFLFFMDRLLWGEDGVFLIGVWEMCWEILWEVWYAINLFVFRDYLDNKMSRTFWKIINFVECKVELENN